MRSVPLPANFTTATRCCWFASETPSFAFAISSTKALAAALSASMRLVESRLPIESSIEPEASRTRTISNGVEDVIVRFDVEEMAERDVRKSESPFSIVMVPPAPVRSMLPSETVLSVQMRPTFSVEFSRPQLRHVDADEGSATVAAKAETGVNVRNIANNNRSLSRLMVTSSDES